MERKKGSFQNSPLIATTSNVVRLQCSSSSRYELVALLGKKGNKPPKASNLSLTDLRVPIPNGPNSFCNALWRPLAYTSCPHFNMNSLLAVHNMSYAMSQQCRGFHSTNRMHWSHPYMVGVNVQKALSERFEKVTLFRVTVRCTGPPQTDNIQSLVGSPRDTEGGSTRLMSMSAV